MSHLKDDLEKAWAEDLQARVPTGHVVFAGRRDAGVKPPFSVVTVMGMEQLLPGSNAWMAEVRVVVACDRAEGGTAAQALRLGEIYEAVEATPIPAADPGRAVVLCGFSLDEVKAAKGNDVYSDVIFITAGVSSDKISPTAPLPLSVADIPDFSEEFNAALEDSTQDVPLEEPDFTEEFNAALED